MSNEFPLATIGNPNEPNKLVSTGFFIDYLLQRNGELPYDQLPSYFDLFPFKPIFERLYDEYEHVPITPVEAIDAMRIAFLDNTSQDQREDPAINLLVERILDQYKGEAAEERVSIFYFDPVASQIRATDIGHGEYGGVNFDSQDIIEKGYVPVLSAHTHPNDSLFSFQDYAHILTAIQNSNNTPIRIFNGMVVLCPGIQVLALATQDTPS